MGSWVNINDAMGVYKVEREKMTEVMKEYRITGQTDNRGEWIAEYTKAKNEADAKEWFDCELEKYAEAEIALYPIGCAGTYYAHLTVCNDYDATGVDDEEIARVCKRYDVTTSGVEYTDISYEDRLSYRRITWDMVA
jgi:hypothetical protein